MSNTGTVIAALKYRGGVLIGADSQASDPPPPHEQQIGVRWSVTKLRQIGPAPIVTGFSGTLGTAQRIFDALDRKTIHPGQLADGTTAQKMLEKTLVPEFHAASQRYRGRQGDVPIAGLSAMFIGGGPLILEHEWTGDSCWHDYFQAIGSGKQTAYAIFCTLGRTRLCELDFDKAVMALLRILVTTINVDRHGVGPPIHVWNVTAIGAVQLGQVEVDHHAQAAEAWIQQEQDAFFGTVSEGAATGGEESGAA